MRKIHASLIVTLPPLRCEHSAWISRYALIFEHMKYAHCGEVFIQCKEDSGFTMRTGS
jgi:hypothetical protein